MRKMFLAYVERANFKVWPTARVETEADAIPFMSDTLLETFKRDIVIKGACFNTVKLPAPPSETCALAKPDTPHHQAALWSRMSIESLRFQAEFSQLLDSIVSE